MVRYVLPLICNRLLPGTMWSGGGVTLHFCTDYNILTFLCRPPLLSPSPTLLFLPRYESGIQISVFGLEIICLLLAVGWIFLQVLHLKGLLADRPRKRQALKEFFTIPMCMDMILALMMFAGQGLRIIYWMNSQRRTTRQTSGPPRLYENWLPLMEIYEVRTVLPWYNLTRFSGR